MMGLLSEEIKITQLINATTGAAGATDIDPSAVDMNGFEGVMFVVVMGAVVANAVTTVKAQQSSDNGVADGFSDLEDTQQTVADDDDNQVFIIDVWKPQKQYVKPYVDRATQNATVQTCLAIQYGARERPTALAVADAINLEQHISPDEGTA